MILEVALGVVLGGIILLLLWFFFVWGLLGGKKNRYIAGGIALLIVEIVVGMAALWGLYLLLGENGTVALGVTVIGWFFWFRSLAKLNEMKIHKDHLILSGKIRDESELKWDAGRWIGLIFCCFGTFVTSLFIVSAISQHFR